MDNPDMNGYEFVEKVIGTDRKYWQKGSRSQGFGGDKDLVFQRYSVAYHYKSSNDKRLPDREKSPYHYDGIKIGEVDGQLVNFRFFFSRKVDSPSNSFVLTPSQLRDFFGKPMRIRVTNPAVDEFSGGNYNIIYIYEKEKYKMRVSFSDPGDYDEELKSERSRHTREQRRAEMNRRRNFSNHKNFQAMRLEITPVNE